MILFERHARILQLLKQCALDVVNQFLLYSSLLTLIQVFKCRLKLLICTCILIQYRIVCITQLQCIVIYIHRCTCTIQTSWFRRMDFILCFLFYSSLTFINQGKHYIISIYYWGFFFFKHTSLEIQKYIFLKTSK